MQLFQLEELIERKYNEAVIIIQKAYRKYKQRRYYLEMRAKAYDVVGEGGGAHVHSRSYPFIYIALCD